MPKTKELLELDVDSLFEEHSIDEIVEIEKLLDAEIERKRSELRSMVGDRYKDVLAASDAIISMKTISQEIVDNIERITNICEELVTNPVSTDTKESLEINNDKIEERSLVIQIRLAIFMNEQIWTALDDESNLEAAQYYLLAQHIHTGLTLSKTNFVRSIPLLQQIKYNLVVLRGKIFEKITEKLESVEITAQETSQNLNALMLLENQSCNDLLSIFIEHRKTALKTVVNSSHSSVRIQINAMVRCLITTVHLLHDCFIRTESGENGLIWQQLDEIVAETAPYTLSKLELPVTSLSLYIPEIIRRFRPLCKSLESADAILNNAKDILEKWLKDTQEAIEKGLEKSLKFITTIKGLHLIREESLKIELPSNWEQICAETYLPENFNVWYYFFQNLISQRCRTLVSTKITQIVEEVQRYVTETLRSVETSDKSEIDLRWYAWTEENEDISKTENSHKGLTMKTKGFSKNIVELCGKMDAKYLELLEDVSQYLYGREYSSDVNYTIVLKDFKFKRKFVDKTEIENHLRNESVTKSTRIADFVKKLLQDETESVVLKSIVCARFLQAIPTFCPNFNKCCTFNNVTDDWLKICDTYNKTGLVLWQYWVEDIVKRTEKQVEKLDDVSSGRTIKILTRWDVIEIQEQTEEKVFKSQIKVPLKPCLVLNEVLEGLNDDVNRVLPHTLPRPIHLQFVERNVAVVLDRYKKLLGENLNQVHALQFLFDVKFLTTLCLPRENVQLVGRSQEICDGLRGRIDPFDLDVFYSYLQGNVKRAVLQSQLILGCLIPSPNQLASLGVQERNKEQDKAPSILALSSSSSASWFPLLPITAPSQKVSGGIPSMRKSEKESGQKPGRAASKRSQDPGSVMRQSAASLFGGLTTDWFS